MLASESDGFRYADPMTGPFPEASLQYRFFRGPAEALILRIEAKLLNELFVAHHGVTFRACFCEAGGRQVATVP